MVDAILHSPGLQRRHKLENLSKLVSDRLRLAVFDFVVARVQRTETTPIQNLGRPNRTYHRFK